MEKESFLSKHIFSTDHKVIARQFLITGMAWAIIGGLFSVLMRLQLGYPNSSFALLQKIGGPLFAGGKIQPEAYYQLMTMHGTIMIFFVLTAGLSGTFANFLIPLQVGARDMASPFINMLSYWAFFIASVVMWISFFVPGGPSGVGWTAYAPLSALHDADSGSGTGLDLWLLSLTFFILSTLMGGINYISTILNMRTKGMAMNRLPLSTWGLLFTAIMGLLSFPVLLAAFILLEFDRNAGTSFYLSNIFMPSAGALPGEGGSAILYQHLFWFLGHPEVYIVIFPAFGMVSEIISVNARKPIFGYTAMVSSMFAILALSFTVWAHHMFVSGLNPILGSIFVLLTLLIAIPSAVKVFNWITTIWRGNIRFTPAMLFSIGFVSVFISGGLTGIWLGNSTLDIPLHDTYFVVAHFHLVMGVASVFGMYAGIYHWFPKMFGRFMNSFLGYIHFWVTLLSAYLIFWPMYYEGLAGMPRRYFEFSAWTSFNQFEGLNGFISAIAILSFCTQIMFLINFFLSIFKGERVMEKNPWQANTLEWTTPIHLSHGNWPGNIPEVFRGPYEYGKEGRDFHPQDEPPPQPTRTPARQV